MILSASFRARFCAAAAAYALSACAVPATEVEVATMPMRTALDLTRPNLPLGTQSGGGLPRLIEPTLPKGAERPLLSTPDVRLAYLYEWIDSEGNKHFGEWVAILVTGFDWIMSDGTHETMVKSAGPPAPSTEKP